MVKCLTNNFPREHFKFIKGKGETIYVLAWTGPEGSRRLKFLAFMAIGT
jgi:hypothetical protein